MYSIDNIVLMKYGAHAGESSDNIIERKQRELKETGQVFWGYGGTLCHPINQIHPFLNENRENNQKTYLVLVKTKKEMENGNNKIQDRLNLYSENKVDWYPIPIGINVTGSKYAIICKSFDICSLDIDLSLYRIPFGSSQGCRLSNYLGWRKNRACGRYNEKDLDIAVSKIVNVSIIAEIVNGVFVQ